MKRILDAFWRVLSSKRLTTNFYTKQKLSYIGNWRAWPPLRRETAAAGPSFFAAATAFGWPYYRLQGIHVPLGYWSELVFLTPARRGLRGHPYQVLQGARALGVSVRIVKYWNKLPASVVTTPPVNVFKKRLGKVWTEVFPHLPHWLNTNLPISLLPPYPNCTPPVKSYHLYMLPNSLFLIYGFFRPVVAYVSPL